MEELGILLAKFVGRIAVFTYSVLAEGFLVYKSYSWFMEKQFSLPHLSYVAAAGANLFASIVIMRYGKKFVYKGEDIEHKIVWEDILTVPWIALGVAYLLFIILKHL